MKYPDQMATEGPRIGSSRRITPKDLDHQYEDYLATQILPTSAGWVITLDNGIAVAVNRVEGGPEPTEGSMIRCYGLGPGFRVRGMDIDRVELYYRTAEQEAERLKDAIDRYNSQEKP